MRPLLLTLLLFSFGHYARAASFDCARAAAPVEIAICADPNVSKLDARLGKVYSDLRKALSEEEAQALKWNQKKWLGKRNNRCGPNFTAQCLNSLYGQRIAVLELLASPDYPGSPAANAAGEYAMGKAMSLDVDALTPDGIAVEIGGAELTMARWICEFSGVGDIDSEGLARVRGAGTGDTLYIAFGNGFATVDEGTGISNSCGSGGSLNGRYVKIASPLWAPEPAPDDDFAVEEDADHQTPLPLVRLRAEQGDAAAQNELGGRYLQADGVPENTEEGLQWLRKAAAQGSTSAMFNLGFVFYYGKGVAKDHEEGMKWFRKASELGDGFATLEIGEIYEAGAGVPRDMEQAITWFRKAADQGDAWAQYRLGILYYKGTEVPRSYDEAVTWFRRAAEQDEAESQCHLALMYMQGEGVHQDLVQSYMWYDIATSRLEGASDEEGLGKKLPHLVTSAQIEKAKTLADEWRAVHRPKSH